MLNLPLKTMPPVLLALRTALSRSLIFCFVAAAYGKFPSRVTFRPVIKYTKLEISQCVITVGTIKAKSKCYGRAL
jgi:hypothetical protein